MNPFQGAPGRAIQRGKEIRGYPSEIENKKAFHGVKRAEGFYIWLSGLLIFLYSVILETVQFFLPYRTFNIKDIAANAS